jgi:hypothetical protein
VKYEDIILNVRPDSLVYKDVKVFASLVYPRLNQADTSLMHLEPSEISGTLIIERWEDYTALKLLDRSHTEHNLWVDLNGVNSHYYKRVTIEIGEAQKKRDIWFAPVKFTAFDPYIYDALTNEVVY